MSGRFIVLEGGDGCGKSTQCGFLAEVLRSRGETVVETREPGGTELGRSLRALLLDGGDLDPVAEALLMAADRAQHVGEVIRPALESGNWVVSDRFVPSSLVYQGVVRGLGVAAIAEISRVATGGLTPDVVILLDVDDETADARRSPGSDRLEREGDAFHREVRDAYRRLAGDEGWTVIDGTATPELVAAWVLAAVDS